MAQESDSCQKQNPTVRNLSNSWRASRFSEDNIVQAPKRGDIRALDAQYYGRARRKYARKQVTKDTEGEVKQKDPRHFQVIKAIVKNLNLEFVKPQRAGVIMYTVINGCIYFGLGLDSRTHDLTDFGGGVVYKYDSNCIKGALREFNEETLSIFEPLSFLDVCQCPVLYDNRNLIIFLHIKLDPDLISKTFNERYKHWMETHVNSDERECNKHTEPEVCGITWLTWEEFLSSIKGKGVIFSRVQRFLSRADNFSYLL